MAKFPSFRQGQGLKDWSASELQRIADAAESFENLRAGPGIRITKNATNAMISLIPQEASRATISGGGLLPCILVTVNKDHLICKPSTDTSSTIKVARSVDTRAFDKDLRGPIPTAFSYSNYNSTWTERFAAMDTNPVVAESQIVLPGYFTEAQIPAPTVSGPGEDPVPSPLAVLAIVMVAGTGGKSGVSAAPDWIEVSNREWRRKP